MEGIMTIILLLSSCGILGLFVCMTEKFIGKINNSKRKR